MSEDLWLTTSNCVAGSIPSSLLDHNQIISFLQLLLLTLSCVAEVHVGGREWRWIILPEQEACHSKSRLQMGAPTRGAKIKRLLGTVAATGDTAVRPCQQRNMSTFRPARQEAVED